LTEQGKSSSVGVPSWDEEATLQLEIQRLLSHLQDLINGRLSAAARTPGHQAVVGRYRDILVDLRNDLEKSTQTVRRASERRELLQGASPSPLQVANGNGTPNDPAMDHLLRERSHIQNSMNTANNVLGQAESVRTSLRYQGQSLRGTQGMMLQLTSNIPGLNSLIENIRRRRGRDDMVVAGVIATCVVFTLWYMFG
jgi:golgi SNAP receptor complex member 1